MVVLRNDIEVGLGSDSASLAPSVRWMVLWTRPRQEKEVARYLRANQCRCYLPLIDRVNFIKGRRFVSRVPLFPSYVFCDGRPEDAYGAISSKRVCQILPVRDQERFVQEISQIRMALSARSQLELYPFAVVGQRCRVKRGPMRGLEGVVVEIAKRNCLVLHVGILGRGAAMEINVDLLEPVHN